ncbi:MAG TPA: hypothetical protein VMX57_04945 [Planctomycetota bacterium]|nr:hypothetical protein [Planctomycetota bacterium]
MARMRRDDRASGLLIALAVLALLAVMATTFVTLMRLDVRMTRNYLDDQHCEMLSQGMLNYFSALLRDDLERTWPRYENRDMGVGVARTYMDGRYVNVPGRRGYGWGTYVSNDFWFATPIAVWGDWGGLYDYNSGWGIAAQESFIWNDYYNRQHGVIGRYYDEINSREIDVFLDRIRNCKTAAGAVVDETHPDAVAGVDDDGDANPNPAWSGDWYWGPYGEEQNADARQYYDISTAIIFGSNRPMFPGNVFTGEQTLPGGVYWRWSVHLGYGHSMYLNLNTAGNVDRYNNALLQNMGGLGLVARPARDEEGISGEHLGRLAWRGFAGEVLAQAGFPIHYNNVAYQPSQVSFERLFNSPRPAGSSITSLDISKTKAQDLIRYRWGADGRPADGTDRWGVGWRRDGATYYKIPSPECPAGDDRYLGVNEVMEHDRSLYHPGTSVIAAILTDVEQRKIRPFSTYWSTDTILRGKIWPTEGPPYTAAQGDWRHINILKRVNINLIGASGPENLTGEDADLKLNWVAKRDEERRRLYYMLVAAMRFTNTPDPERQACQFVASLADMVDRDHDETYYSARDHAGDAAAPVGAWALGVEKFPVFNEIAFYSGTNAHRANYDLTRLRIELYNTAENIPWIPDVDEAYDISDYVVQIASHDYRLGDLYRFTENVDEYYGGAGSSGRVSQYPKIGADGMYALPVDTSPGKMTWQRFAHIGWANEAGGNFPTDLTRSELEGASFAGVEFKLWKPLQGEAEVALRALVADPQKVRVINGRAHVCVDRTGLLKLVKPYGSFPFPGGPGAPQTSYLGLYRRWDPMNAKIFGTQGNDETSNVVWYRGWGLTDGATLGSPNIEYPLNAVAIPRSSWNGSFSSNDYERRFERNFKVVDGDLPSIGWLGEVILHNAAQDGPLTRIHDNPQDPTVPDARYPSQSDLDCKAKFDLYRPFRPLNRQGIIIDPNWQPSDGWPSPREVMEAIGPAVHPENLHVLDCFTVWDPSNDGVDNDGDGAVDDDDTGNQDGDRGGPEVRVFGRIDLNFAGYNALLAVFPDSPDTRYDYAITHIPNQGADDSGIAPGRQTERGADYHGPYETIGDLLRIDGLSTKPGSYFGGCGYWENLVGGQWRIDWVETGFSRGDDDGDGIPNERDERDMFFTWVSSYVTTRANVFEINLNVDITDPPYHPGVKLPMRAYKSKDRFARKQLMGVLDRSTTLRIGPGGRCDFTGPVDKRVIRFSDDLHVY